MGGANVKGLSDEQGGEIVRVLRQEYDTHTSGDNAASSDLLQTILTNKFKEVTEDLEENSLGDSLTCSATSDVDHTIDMLNTLTLKGTHFLDLMNYFESDDPGEFNSYFDGEHGDTPTEPKVIDPWTQTMDMRSVNSQ
jgi:hypothetical protein